MCLAGLKQYSEFVCTDWGAALSQAQKQSRLRVRHPDRMDSYYARVSFEVNKA